MKWTKEMCDAYAEYIAEAVVMEMLEEAAKSDSPESKIRLLDRRSEAEKNGIQ